MSWRALTAIVVSAALVLVVAGCGGGETSSTPSSPTACPSAGKPAVFVGDSAIQSD